MARIYWYFFAIGAFFLISASGQSDSENLVKSDSASTGPKIRCPEKENCDSESTNAGVTCRQADENGDCRDASCADGQELDPATGECREVTKCEDGPCDEKMQKMQESPKRTKKMRSKKGLHIALILKKKKQLMKPFMKPKPPPHHPHHEHHHHSSESEPEDEEEPIPEPDDAPDAPEIRLFNDEICADGTVNCMNSTVAPEASGAGGNATAKPRKQRPRARKEKPVAQPDPAEANVRKRVIRFLKVLRMRRRLSPLLGRLQRKAPKISPEEKKRK